LIALKSKEVTGTRFMQILESRLDNLVFRLGFAKTRKAARQLVNHGHITVNGAKIDIPSYLCEVNNVIAVAEKSKNLVAIKASLASNAGTLAYVTVDKEKLSGVFARFPERKELPQDINEAQIVEYYNRLL
jgi:small subunit ribosomal protein S4